MNRSWLVGIAAACMIVAMDLPARAQRSGGDVIKTRSAGRVKGNVETITRNEVVISQDGISKTLQADDVERIVFLGEPDKMQLAWTAADKGDYANALKDIDKLKPDDLDRDLLRTELAYMKLVFAVKLAITGETDSDDDQSSDTTPADLTRSNSVDVTKENPVDLAKEVGPQLIEFLKQNSNSFHFYEGNELVGDLLVWLGNVEQKPAYFASASTYYAELAKSPWPEFRARADLLRARQLQLQGKYDESLAAYDAVLRVNASGEFAESQLQEAAIGRTYCLVGTNKAREALKILQDTIAKADDDDTVLLARAYCALGNCYRALNDNQQALWAYLRVDLEYPSAPESHAEALANLEVLWSAAHRPDRARDAHDYLLAHYPFSRWSKRSQAH